MLFASGEKQPWANGNKYEKLSTDESSTDEYAPYLSGKNEN